MPVFPEQSRAVKVGDVMRMLLSALFVILSGGPAACMTIPEAKLLPDGAQVSLQARCVSYSAADFFYIEEDGRNMGLRVERPEHGLTVGLRADVTGVMRTNEHDERYVAATKALRNGRGIVRPVGMTGRALGGKDWEFAPDTGRGQKGVSDAAGLNNIGLLVRICGKVMQGAPGDTETLHLDDGSDAHVSVILPPRAGSPGYGAHVAVVGVSSIARDHGQGVEPPLPASADVHRRVVLARDLQIMESAPQWRHSGAMVYIPAGSFLMGNNGSEPFSYDDELPQHSVYLSGFWIGKFEVTRGEYRQFLEATGYREPPYWDAVQDWGTGSYTQTDAHPVVGLDKDDAAAYCAWAGGRLPTEAEWEKAARWTGSYANVYSWGNVWDVEKCNNAFDHNPAAGGYARNQTSPVGSYPLGASPYGCHDMAGNAWEWCLDWYDSSYYAMSLSADPQGPASPSSSQAMVMRGGSWYVSGAYQRCAARFCFYPSYYYYSPWYTWGLRIAR